LVIPHKEFTGLGHQLALAGLRHRLKGHEALGCLGARLLGKTLEVSDTCLGPDHQDFCDAIEAVTDLIEKGLLALFAVWMSAAWVLVCANRVNLNMLCIKLQDAGGSMVDPQYGVKAARHGCVSCALV
jgi:hypothetical protein